MTNSRLGLQGQRFHHLSIWLIIRTLVPMHTENVSAILRLAVVPNGDELTTDQAQHTVILGGGWLDFAYQ